ncbi:tachylectin-related carbohydrate-binding protein [Amycolatopsis dendrobii]|uniref:Trypsin-like serine protease n=1 Tax=Amycolatopsis dendrobii TaxID=2760662 RepID=A0A7W3W0T1_9PSEU|nr:tachylectin-related carbohydrate-binding protein [Amycolatopsis dendrobii]MBB1156759.1 trypsin-like serine protease [Amycolatopsis dendrobii]
MSRRTQRALAISATLLTGGVLTAIPAHAISGGTVVPSGTSGYLARITTPTKACSAALIDPQWVITSGSCLTASATGAPTENATVSVGAVDVSTGAGTNAKVVKVIGRSDRDVALAKLEKPTTGIAPVALATTAPTSGETLQLAGFGRTATEWVPARPSVASFSVSAVNATEVSVTSANGSDTCLGDAGGPALRTVGDKVEVVAVNSRSWQHGCLAVTETREGGTEARVDDLADWVRQNTVPTPVSCPNGAVVWDDMADGTLWRHIHNGPVNGTASWTEPTKSSGNGWFGRPVAGKNGAMWDVHRSYGAGDPYGDGVLKLWKWDGANLTGGKAVGDGWARYLTPEFKNRITVDQSGRIFMVNDQGELRAYLWDDTAGKWVDGNGQLVDTGWTKYDSITAAGDGVLYARTPNGNLYRFQYDFGAAKWTQREKLVGTGWNIFSGIFSPGADILYGRGAWGPGPWDGKDGPVLRWYRYSANTDTWLPVGTSGTSVGSGWNTDLHATAAPDSCRLVP